MCFEKNNVPCPQEKECQICYEKSFASYEKSKYWSDKNEFKPWQFKKQSQKKFWFKCDKSNHEFESTISHISTGSWCPYPCCCKSNGKLCIDESCNICFNASFASHEKAECWSDKNKISPRN